MSNQRSEVEWARDRIEAAVDDSLGPDEQRRFDAAASQDQALAQAVRQARNLRNSLRDLRDDSPMPTGLLWRLLQVPQTRPRRTGSAYHWLRPALPIAAAVVALLVFTPLRQPIPEDPDPAIAAVREFAIAMAYLRKGTQIANEEISGQVRNGFRDAFEVSRESLLEDTHNGG